MDKQTSNLINTLSKIAPQPGMQSFVIESIGLNPGLFNLYNTNSLVAWSEIVSKSKHLNKFEKLLKEVLLLFPDLPEATTFFNGVKEVKEIEIEKWNFNETNYQKVIEGQDTFLPISFLTKGQLVSKAVCKVLVRKKGNLERECGTGFLIKGDFLITNNHVISTFEEALNIDTEIVLNFETSMDGNSKETSTFKLDPNTYFKTNDCQIEDITVVKVLGKPTVDFGYLKLAEVGPSKFDYVNIIQHPDGGHKKIALYHNVVVYSDDSIVQYLTDTRNGSSGSPVFNSNWEVVALHNAGGYLKEPSTDKVYFRNQGLNVAIIKKYLC